MVNGTATVQRSVDRSGYGLPRSGLVQSALCGMNDGQGISRRLARRAQEDRRREMVGLARRTPGASRGGSAAPTATRNRSHARGKTKRPPANGSGLSCYRCPQGGQRALGTLEMMEASAVTAEPGRMLETSTLS